MKVIKPFIEKFDSNHNYKIGDEYPRNGFEPPNGRIEALHTAVKCSMNNIGDQFLEFSKMVDMNDEKPKRGRPAKRD